MMSRHVQDKSRLSKAVCPAHLYKVYQFDNFDHQTMQRTLETHLCQGDAEQKEDWRKVEAAVSAVTV